jgi:hypothetical protein
VALAAAGSDSVAPVRWMGVCFLALAGAAFDDPLPTGHVELEAAIARWGTS